MRRAAGIVTFSIAFILSICVSALAGPVPDTGQTESYTDTFGEDSDYNINPPSYTKMDAQGNFLPDWASEWAMIRDNVTGLIWEVKQDKDGVQDYSNPHDADNTYSWYDSNPETNGGDAGTPGDGTNTEDFINALNAENFGGFSDWRLPTVKELAYLVKFSGGSPRIATEYFPDCRSEYYWSSSTYADSHSSTWSVWFDSGAIGSLSKSDSRYVRAVRGNTIDSRLVDNGDATITDKSTGLMWVQEIDGTARTWHQALAFCEDLTVAGYDDWRLPSYKELASIMDYSRSWPALTTQFFTNVSSERHLWTSTSPWSSSACRFYSCNGESGSETKTNGSSYVFAVRGGQPVIDGHILISQPESGTIWGISKDYTIKWDPNGTGDNVNISISREGGKTGTFTTIVESTENDGAYTWTVSGPESHNCILRVEPLSNPDLGSQAGLFAIKEIRPESITRPYQVAIIGGASEQIPLTVWALEGTYDLTTEISSWSSSDESVATVDPSGVVTGLKEGKTTIQANYGDENKTLQLEVVESFTPEAEPNDTTATATSLQEGQWTYGTISGDADKDTFKIDLPEDQTVRLEMLLNSVGQSAQVTVRDNLDSIHSEFRLTAQDWNRQMLTLSQGSNTVMITSGISGEYLIRYVFLSKQSGGQKIWEFPLYGNYSSPAIAGNRIFVRGGSSLYCLDSVSGANIWDFQAGSEISSSPMVYAGRVYVATSYGRIYSIDSRTGSKVWSVNVRGDSGHASPAISDGRLYIASRYSDVEQQVGVVSCLDLETGETIWEYETSGYIYGSPAVGDGKVFIGAEYRSNNMSFGKVYILDAGTGARLKEYLTGAAIYSSPAYRDGIIYIGCNDGKIYAIDAKENSLVWSFDTGNSISWSSPAVTSGRLYIGNDGFLFCLDRQTGIEIWRRWVGNTTESSPAVVNNKVFVGSTNGTLYCLDAVYGDQIWQYYSNSGIYTSPSISQGKVYFGNSNGMLCLDAGDPDADGWQMYRHDLSHSGDTDRGYEGLYGAELAKPCRKMILGGETSTLQLKLFGKYLDGFHDVTSQATSWTTSDGTIATVSPSGLVTATGAGMVTIQASYEGHEASIDILIEPLPTVVEIEPNDALSQAGLLTESDWLYGTISSISDVDNFRVELNDTQKIGIEVLFNGCLPPAKLQVTDEFGTLFAQLNIYGGIAESCVVELFSGTNYVTLETDSSQAPGEYLIRYVVLTNPEAGEKLWEYASGISIESTPAIMGGNLYIGINTASGGELQCINLATGSKAWAFNMGGGISSSPMIYRGLAFVGSSQGKVMAIDLYTAQKIWEFQTGGISYSSPAISEGKLYIGSTDNRLYCLAIDTGEEVWSYETGGSIYSSPSIMGNNVYFGSNDDKIYCLDKSTGRLVWEHSTGGDVRSSPAIVDGLLYVGSSDGRVYCMDIQTGTKVWDFGTNSSIGYSSPAVAGGRVYVGTNSGLCCVDALTGIKLWSYPGSFSTSSPAISNGKVYIGSGDWENGKLYCLDSVGGTKLWQFTTGGGISSSPIASGGKIFVSSNYGKLYCLDAGDPDADGWQMYRHDLEHRGDGSIHMADFSGITLAKTDDHLTLGGLNNQIQLQAYGDYLDGSFEMTGEIETWTTSDEAIATVSNTGIVTAISAGTATITAGYGAYTSSIQVRVEALPENVEIEPNETADSATPLRESETFYGSLESDTDVDVFKIDLSQSQTIRLEVIFNKYLQDTDILVSDADGKELLRFSPASINWNRKIITLPPGVSTVSLRSTSGMSGEYLIRYEFICYGNGGTELWEFEAGGSIESSPAISGGKLYFGDSSGKVYCLDADSGERIWFFETDGGVQSSPIISGNRLYVGNSNGRVYCLDAGTGIKIWEYSTGNSIYSSPALAGNRLYVGSWNKLVCLNADTGTKIWEQPTQDYSGYSSPTVSAGKVYVGSRFYFNAQDYGKLYCFDAETGEKIWVYLADGNLESSSPAIADGRIYVGSGWPQHKFYCLDAASGDLIWDFSAYERVSSPIIYNGKVYVGSYGWDGPLYCLDAGTGALVWEYHTGGQGYIRNAPAISNGKVYIGSEYEHDGIHCGRIHCVDAETGTLLWRTQTDGVINNSSPAVENGRVYIGATNGKFYCVDAGDPAAGGWTMFQHDLQHTGDSSHSKIGTPRYFVSLKPVDAMETYKFYLVGEYQDGNHEVPTLWTSSDNRIATVQGNILTAQQNGRVVVSAEYGGSTYEKILYLQPDFDEYEWLYNNTMEEATPLDNDEFIMGEMLLNDVDFYSFNLTIDSLIEVAYMSYSDTADTLVEILDSAGNLMASTVSTDGRELVFSLGLSAGKYYVRLTGAGDIDQDTNYVVTRHFVGNLPPKSAEPMGLGESVESSINNLQDQSEFTFSLGEKQGIKIAFSPTSESAKYRIELLDTSQAVIDRVDALFGLPVYLESTYKAGNYIIRITPLAEVDAASSFTVTLGNSSSILEEEPNEIYSLATPFSVGESIKGRLSHPGDEDFYGITIEAPRYLDLSFTCPHSYRNFRISIYKDSDENLINGVDAIEGKDVTLPMGLSIGRYYIKIAGHGEDIDVTHYYTLTLEDSQETNLEIESNNTLKFANAIEKNTARKGRIFSADDIDYYGFYLPAQGYFSISFIPETTFGDYRISLVNDNDEVAYQKISTDGQAVQIDVNPFPGNYFIKVVSNGDIDQYSFYKLLVGTEVEDFEILGLKSLVSVTLSGTTSEMSVGESQGLTATAGYSDATSEIIANPIWTSLDESVATVNAAGLVTAVGEGATTIVATYGGLTGQFVISVGAPTVVHEQHHGNLVLVAGGGVEVTNTLKDSTQYLSDLVYKRFKSRLFTDDDIYYINPMTWHDVDGDGYDDNIVDDESPTVAGFGVAITDWAASRSTDGPLYVYLIDHGGIDKFNIFPNEILHSGQLKTYLDTFQEATGRQVVVIIEACKSGSFTDDVVVSGEKRTVITSTDTRNGYLQMDGRVSFTQFFTDNLYAGESIKSAFLKASDKLKEMTPPYNEMEPQLAEGIELAAAHIHVGGNFAIAGLEPEFDDWSPNQTVPANQAHTFYAQLSDLEDIERVWAVVVPPGYTPPEVGQDFETPEVNLPTFDLTDPEKDGRYEGSYDGFVYNDVYRITFYASNRSGSVAVSPVINIRVEGGTGLDSDGDGMPNDWEDQYQGLDKDVDDGLGDMDGDGLTNYQEYQHGTSPIQGDTDSDGMDDSWEVSWGFNPTVADGHLDADGDGVTNLTEYQDGTNPLNNNSFLDHVLPRVVSVSPVEGEVHVDPDTDIQIGFSEAMDTGTISINQFTILGDISGSHLGDLTYDAVHQLLLIIPDFSFEYGETVEVTMSCDLTDIAGNPLDGNENSVADSSPADDYVWSFTIADSPDITPPNPYDTNEDWMIGDFELLDAIDAWANGAMAVLIGEACDVDFYLLDLIDIWKADTYEYEEDSGNECFPWNGVN